MTFRKRKRPQNVKMAARAKKVASPDLIDWVDTTILALGSTFDAWRYHNAPSGEFTMHLDAINAMWAELSERNLTRD